MKLSILVPVYNEEQTIKRVINKLLELKLPWNTEIIVVDDGSTDRTGSILRKAKFKHKTDIKIIRHKFNKGKGKAIQSGIGKATGDYLLIQDADLEYDPSEIPKLIAPLLNDKYKRSRASVMMAVYGSRFKKGKPAISPIYYIGNIFLTQITNILYGTSLTDMETGYKLLPAKFMKSLKLVAKRFDIEPEITAKLIKAKIPIIEVPISYKGRSHLAGKKLTPADAFSAIKTLISLREK